MTKIDEITQALDRIKELILEIDADAYRRGWDEALERLIQTAEQGRHEARVTPTPEPIRPQPIESSVPHGTVPKMVRGALTEQNGSGTAQVVQWAKQHDERISPHSVRTALARMTRRGEVKRARGKWYLVQSASTKNQEQNAAGPTGNDDPAASDASSKGGRHVRGAPLAA